MSTTADDRRARVAFSTEVVANAPDSGDIRADAVQAILERIRDNAADMDPSELRDLAEALSYVQNSPPAPRTGRVVSL